VYGRVPVFWESVYESSWLNLLNLLRYTYGWFVRQLEITTPHVLASELRPNGHKTERLLNICEAVDATTYLSGPKGREYLELERFERVGVEVRFHDYEPMGDGLSAIDTILGGD
jgi:hypothetical protein